MAEQKTFIDGYERAIKNVVPENIVGEARNIVKAHKPTSLELADFKHVAFKKINPNDLNGVDLRTLSEKQTRAIVYQYHELRETANGYNLGQGVMALRAARQGKEDGIEGFDKFLEDDEAWTFRMVSYENSH